MTTHFLEPIGRVDADGLGGSGAKPVSNGLSEPFSTPFSSAYARERFSVNDFTPENHGVVPAHAFHASLTKGEQEP